jgi:hypothetical protein
MFSRNSIWNTFARTWVAAMVAFIAVEASAVEERVSFDSGDGHVAIVVDGLQIAVYSYRDDAISRPYFAHVRAPGGVQVTRNHPPVEGQDLMDHGTFHPGIWMSFGDISGSDYWRLKSPVRHVEFVEPPTDGAGQGSFAVRNEYLDQNDLEKVVCNETARYTVLVRPAGYLLLWDSLFSGDREFAFGDQEEMGVGFRVATPLRVGASGKEKVPPGNGTILDAAGRKNGDQVWGNSADWCDFSGTIAGQHAGMTVFCHPNNFRPTHYHARDYGLLQANAFALKAFAKGEASRVVVKPGETLRLRYGILLHAGPHGSKPDLGAAYNDYVQQAGK